MVCTDVIFEEMHIRLYVANASASKDLLSQSLCSHYLQLWLPLLWQLYTILTTDVALCATFKNYFVFLSCQQFCLIIIIINNTIE